MNQNSILIQFLILIRVVENVLSNFTETISKHFIVDSFVLCCACK